MVEVAGASRCASRARRGGWAVAASTALVLASGGAHAQTNLIANGSFDSDVSGFFQSYDDGSRQLSLIWSAEDADQSPSSGSALFSNTSVEGSDVKTVPLLSFTCAEIGEGETVSYGADVLIPSGQSSTGFARVLPVFYTGSGCTGVAVPREPLLPAVSTPGSWRLTGDADRVPDENHLSLRLGLAVTKREAGGELDAHFDNVFLVLPEPGPMAALWAVATGLVVAQRRGRRARGGA